MDSNLKELESGFANLTTDEKFVKICKLQGLNPDMCLPDVTGVPDQHKQAVLDITKLFIIYDFINSDQVQLIPDKCNSSPLFFTHPQFRFVGLSFWESYSNMTCRLMSDSSTKSRFIATHFEELYKNVIVYEPNRSKK